MVLTTPGSDALFLRKNSTLQDGAGGTDLPSQAHGISRARQEAAVQGRARGAWGAAFSQHKHLKSALQGAGVALPQPPAHFQP